MTTLISHIYNEEFLLPFFIERHYEKFDQGIILDYGSTDGSLRVLKELAPNWSIIDCSEEAFDALKLDALVHSIEEKISGVCLVLTITEFFVGDPRFITSEMVLPGYSFLRKEGEPGIQAGQCFHEVYKTGISPFQLTSEANTEWITRMKGRKIKGSKEKYPIGRHYEVLGHTPFLIYRVANCLASDEMIERRLQIQKKIPLDDIKLGLGVQHTNYGKGLDVQALKETIDSELLMSTDISNSISRALEIENRLVLLETNSRDFNFVKDIISGFETNQRFMRDILEEKLKIRSEKLAIQIELEQLRIEHEALIQDNQKHSMFVESSLKLEERLQEAEKQIIEIADVSARAQQNLMRKIEFLEVQSRRPSRNLLLLLTNTLPAIKLRIKKLFD